MILGHTGTALVAYSRVKKSPFWLFFIAANLLDLLWFTFIALGIETVQPTSLLDISLQSLKISSPYSHSPVFAPIFAAIFAALVYLIFRRRDLAMASGILVILHGALDFLCAWDHPIFGNDPPRIGLNLYRVAPYFSLFLDAAFGALCVYLYVSSERAQDKLVSRRNQVALYAFFILGVLIFLPIAKHSLREIVKL